MRSPAQQSLLNAYWIPLNFQISALLTIAIPAMLLHFPGVNHLQTYAMLASLVGFISMVVPPIAGEISDRYHRTGTPRRPLIIAGALVNAAGLLWMVFAHDVATFTAAVIIATIGQNASQAAYSALIPEVVPRDHWGAASGYQGVGALIGSIVGLAVAGISGATGTDTLLYVAAAIVIAGSLTVLWVPEGAYFEGEHVHVSDWRNFSLVFTSRFWTNFGLALLGTFILFFFSDILKVKDASASTSLAGVMTLAGAIVSSIAMGYVSDRIPRKLVVAFAGVPMAIAAIGFAAEPNLKYILIFAIFFGLGYGTIVSTGWALAIDSVPALGNVARDLGIWGIAANLPYIIAPQVGKWIISGFGAQLALGYRLLFVAGGASFLLGSAILLFAGRGKSASSEPATSQLPSLPPAGGPLQTFAMFLITPYYNIAYRIRGWGRLPRQRGATLLVSNHQHDLDTTALIMRLNVQEPSMRPIYMVGSRRIFEPGFMEVRFAPIRWIVELVDWAWMYQMLGVLPIENELRRRSVASLAYAIHNAHGDLPVAQVFSSRANHALGKATTLKSLIGRPLLEQHEYVSVSTINEPYRSELIDRTRVQTESDLVRIEGVLRAGGTLYLTAEGKYTRDGKINRFRTAFSRVAPLGEHYLLALSYDVFAGGRLSLLYRVLRPVYPDDLAASLAASRPITLSQLLAAWLRSPDGLSASHATFTRDAAFAGVRTLLDEVPSSAFLDPDLRLRLSEKLDDALSAMVKRGLLSIDANGSYGPGTTSHDPRFPLVPDIVAHQANFFAETVAACSYPAAIADALTASAPSSR
ncbi:MAG TPA: MFS transporter [Candidatus Eremiobacteraceae bacterium]|nr:MFS transporter [Candidatus Eremiobacteraceae bacterium]